MHCTKLVLEVYQFYDREHKYGLYNSNSIKYTMLCAAAEKDLHTLQQIYNSLTESRQKSIVITCISIESILQIATYIRCLLSMNKLKSATTLLSSMLNSPEYRKHSIISKNDVYSNIIVGRIDSLIRL